MTKKGAVGVDKLKQKFKDNVATIIQQQADDLDDRARFGAYCVDGE